jgi:Exo-beta-1,3-glucanase
MNRSVDFVIPILIAVLTISAWWILNRPNEEPAWPTRIQGFCFSPMRAAQDPNQKRFPTLEDIDADLALLAGRTHAVRTYSVENSLGEIPRLAAKHRLNVTLGAWIGPDLKANESELTLLREVLAKGYRNLVRVIVGNEAILRKDVSVDQMIDYLERIRRITYLPVSTAEPWHVWLKNPQLVEHVDFITIHLLPYWEGVPLDQAVDYAVRRYNQVKTAYPDKPIIIGEVGWPSNGRRNRGAEASLANQTRFLRRFLAVAESEHYVYYVMEAFDQLWKLKTEGATGTYWGVYNVAREPKFTFTEPVVRIPQWRELAGLSVVMGVLLLTFLYRDSATLSKRGKGFLALITYAISTAAVWDRL